MEHVAVDIAVGADGFPDDLGVSEAEIFLLLGLDLAEFDGVGVARVEDDLDEVDVAASSDAELKAVFEIHEGVSSEHTEGEGAQLLGDGLGDHELFPWKIF